mmetsp:Transcript_81156/g.225862  ORF Transcript_81156/g.225862 Transcript_81156/m.225862 type:complete len:228 (+) Transcript_81156:48-731(+)
MSASSCHLKFSQSWEHVWGEAIDLELVAPGSVSEKPAPVVNRRPQPASWPMMHEIGVERFRADVEEARRLLKEDISDRVPCHMRNVDNAAPVAGAQQRRDETGPKRFGLMRPQVQDVSANDDVEGPFRQHSSKILRPVPIEAANRCAFQAVRAGGGAQGAQAIRIAFRETDLGTTQSRHSAHDAQTSADVQDSRPFGTFLGAARNHEPSQDDATRPEVPASAVAPDG